MSKNEKILLSKIEYGGNHTDQFDFYENGSTYIKF